MAKTKSKTPEMVVKKLLEKPYWLKTLEAGTVYSRLHDDHDGTFEGRICVQFTPDGDAWISNDSQLRTLRFRVPIIGGGRSPRVRNALMILAEAIRLDNKADPHERP